MRYYSIVITDSTTGALITTPSSLQGSGATYSSYAKGATAPGALNVEFDIPIAPYHLPSGAAYARIWGISLAEISQATNLGATPSAPGKNVAIYAGMQKGLPLANPAQAGLLVQGQIFQAFGNWIETDMTLDLILYPPTGSPGVPKNIVVDWKAGTPLAQAIANTLSVALPGMKQDIEISPNLVLAHDEPGYYESLTQFAQWAKEVSQDTIGGTYQGVSIAITQDTIRVFDGTTPKTPKQITFQDMIGQPTWVEAPIIQVTCVMRADLSIGDYIKLPPAVVTTTSAAASSLLNLKSAFEGAFQIRDIHHFGNYRQPDAAAWTTVINAYPAQLN